MCKRRRGSNNCGHENSCGFNGTNGIVDPIRTAPERNHCRRGFFPNSIKDLLILIAEEDDENKVTLILDVGSDEESVLEDVRVIAVLDNTLVANCHDAFRFINICCICEVIVDCHTILEELFELHNINRS